MQTPLYSISQSAGNSFDFDFKFYYKSETQFRIVY